MKMKITRMFSTSHNGEYLSEIISIANWSLQLVFKQETTHKFNETSTNWKRFQV